MIVIDSHIHPGIRPDQKTINMIAKTVEKLRFITYYDQNSSQL